MTVERFVIYVMPCAMGLYTFNFWLNDRQEPPEVTLRKRMNQQWMLHPAAKEFRDKHLQDIGYDLPDKEEKVEQEK